MPLSVLRDTIQPFPTFSEIFADALQALDGEIAAAEPVALPEVVIGGLPGIGLQTADLYGAGQLADG